MPEKFTVEGKKHLGGILEVRGAKNVAMPLLAAACLTDEPCMLRNIPLIEDVFLMLKMLESAGVTVKWTGEREVVVQAKYFDSSKIDFQSAIRLRGSVLLLAPLCVRASSFSFPHPGGDAIGARPIDSHLNVLEQFGVSVRRAQEAYRFETPKKFSATRIVLPELSVTATENALLLACAIDGKTVIHIADSDYQVQELSIFLRKMGVKIRGVGTHTLEVYGKKKLCGASHTVISDPIEAGTFILLSAATRSSLAIHKVPTAYLTLFLKRVRDFGLSLTVHNESSVEVNPWGSLTIDKIQTLPHPGIASDLQSAFGVLATQTKGATLLHDPLYEGRLKYLEELNRMGAEVIFCDPHRAIINGPTQLYGTSIRAGDIRGGAALVIAGLIAEGTTTIENIYQIDRGYEKIDERLRKIGADIRRTAT